MSALRREALRRQLDLLHDIRGRMLRESDADYAAWAGSLIPLTDSVLLELAARGYRYVLGGWGAGGGTSRARGAE